MSKLRKILNPSGFTLLEIMISVAIMGGFALTFSKMMTDQNKSVKTIETRSEINALVNDIRGVLADSRSCEATFLNRDAKALPEGAVTEIIQATQSGNIPRFVSNLDWKQGTAYGNGTVRILSIALSDANNDPGIEVTAVPAVTSTGVTEIIVKFSRGEGRVFGSDVLERRIRLGVTTQVGNTLIKTCTTAGADNTLNNLAAACAAIDGLYDSGTEKCILTSYITPLPTPHSTAVSTNFLSGWFTGVLTPTFINASGDTMNGTLNFSDAHGIILQTGEIDFASDKNLKKEIKDLPESLPNIRKMRPVSFKWKSNDKYHTGVIAQELAEIYPNLVKTVGSDETLAVDYVQLIPVLIKGLKEMDKENQFLKKEMRELKQHICKKDSEYNGCKTAVER